MKTALSILSLLYGVSQAFAQFNPTPIGTLPGPSNVNGNLYVAYVDHDDPKYVHFDQTLYTVTMYNMDLSLYRQFAIPSVYQSGYPRIFHVTNRMFDCDSTTVEYILTMYNPMTSTYVAVIREDGTVLLHRQNAVFSASVTVEPYADFKNTGVVNHNGHGLLSIAHFGNGNYEIYELCEELPRQYSRMGAGGSGITTTHDTEADGSHMILYPVPTGGELRMVLPSGKLKHGGEARIYDLKGSLLLVAELPAGTSSHTYNIASLSQGTYMLTVTNGAGFKSSRRFVKQ